MTTTRTCGTRIRVQEAVVMVAVMAVKISMKTARAGCLMAEIWRDTVTTWPGAMAVGRTGIQPGSRIRRAAST